MTDHTTAAQAADTNPLSDEYVNAVIQQHGYDSPECVIARLHQWIGLHGGENGLTLLMYEAHKALVKLRAPVADERDRNATISAVFSRCSLIPGATFWNAAEFMYDEMHRRAAMPRDPIADEETFQAWADRFPEISDMGRLREAWHAALASAPVAGDGKTRVPGDHLGGPVVAWDDGALSIPNRPESRADTGSTGGALAPVAGEAVAWRIKHPHSPVLGWRDAAREVPPSEGEVKQQNPDLILELAYAAPQASEAVRILFPAHLRKMWSGGEVQAWLDEHQGVTPPRPSIRGSLERYREWQAKQAVAPELAKGCHRSHPHENMSPECEAKTIQARADNAAAQDAAQASAPSAGEAKPSAFILAPIQQDHTLLVRYHFGLPPAEEAAPGASEAKQLDVPASSMLELFLSALPEIQATIRANHELRAALILARDSHGVCLLTDPPQDAWKARRVDEVIRTALSAQPEQS